MKMRKIITAAALIFISSALTGCDAKSAMTEPAPESSASQTAPPAAVREESYETTYERRTRTVDYYTTPAITLPEFTVPTLETREYTVPTVTTPDFTAPEISASEFGIPTRTEVYYTEIRIYNTTAPSETTETTAVTTTETAVVASSEN